jgi:hypothetical protein
VCSSFGVPTPWEAFESFRKRYTRATDILWNSWDLSKDQVFTRVRGDRRKFEKMKFLVKCLFVWLYWATTPQMNDREIVKRLVYRLAAAWDLQKLVSCPKLELIHRKYLTFVKQLPEESYKYFN